MFQTRYINTYQTYQWIDDHPPSQTYHACISSPQFCETSSFKTVSWRHIAVQKFLVKPMLNPCFIISVGSTSAIPFANGIILNHIQPRYHGATAQLLAIHFGCQHQWPSPQSQWNTHGLDLCPVIIRGKKHNNYHVYHQNWECDGSQWTHDIDSTLG